MVVAGPSLEFGGARGHVHDGFHGGGVDGADHFHEIGVGEGGVAAVDGLFMTRCGGFARELVVIEGVDGDAGCSGIGGVGEAGFEGHEAELVDTAIVGDVAFEAEVIAQAFEDADVAEGRDESAAAGGGGAGEGVGADDGDGLNFGGVEGEEVLFVFEEGSAFESSL